MAVFLEILKFTLPGLIVFAAVYYILRQYLNNQYELKALELKANYTKDAIPLKLKAYERLLLLCERIRFPQLLLRLKTKEMTARDLKNALVISVQKEYEHNMAQQLYCSNKLWEILTLTKNDLISIISGAYGKVRPEDNADVFAEKLLETAAKMGKSPLDVSIQAIKEEAKIILNV